MLKIAEKAKPDEREYWLRRAGVDLPSIEETVRIRKKTGSYVDGDMLIVPIRTGAIAAGQPLSMDVNEYEGRIGIPLAEAADTSRFVAARVKGNSMAPRIMEGYIVIVDTRRRPPKENVGHIVAASDEQDGMTIKMLAESNGTFFLIAGNPDYHPHAQPIDAGHRWAIMGRVVKWVGAP